MNQTENFKETVPVGDLGIIPLESCSSLGKRVNDYIVAWRKERSGAHMSSIHFEGYQKENYIIDAKCSRFGSGEARARSWNRFAARICTFL